MPRNTWKIDLGRQIREARERLRITQEDLADRVKAQRGSICLYEAGRGNPQFRVVADIARILKADFSVLGCRIAASEALKPKEPQSQLELKFDQDHSFLANVTIRPTEKSITITTHADYGIKSA